MTPMTPARRAPHLLKALLLVVLMTAASFAQAADKTGYLGVHLQDLDSSMRTALQMGDESGVLINDVVDEGPAAKAGLEDGDVIVKFGKTKIEDSDALVEAVRDAQPGEKVELTILRGGKKKNVDVEIGERDDDVMVWTHPQLKMMKDGEGPHGFRWFQGKDGDGDIEIMTDGDADVFFDGEDLAFFGNNDRGYLGIHLDNLNEQLGKYFEVDGGEGVLVTEVVEDSPAQKAGLKAGDVIVELDGAKIASTKELHQAMAKTEAEQKIKVTVSRKGDRKSFDVTLGEMPENEFFGQMKVLGGDDGHFQVRAPRMRMHRIERDGQPGQRRIVIEKQSDEMDDLRDEMQSLKKELKELKEELKK